MQTNHHEREQENMRLLLAQINSLRIAHETQVGSLKVLHTAIELGYVRRVYILNYALTDEGRDALKRMRPA